MPKFIQFIGGPLDGHRQDVSEEKTASDSAPSGNQPQHLPPHGKPTIEARRTHDEPGDLRTQYGQLPLRCRKAARPEADCWPLTSEFETPGPTGATPCFGFGCCCSGLRSAS